VSGATVAVQVLRSGKTVLSGTGTTDVSGQTSLVINNAPGGTYQTVIQSVAAGSLIWDGVTPENSFVK
jgi:hypothetical protein